jgi:hypothetical protein
MTFRGRPWREHWGSSAVCRVRDACTLRRRRRILRKRADAPRHRPRKTAQNSGSHQPCLMSSSRISVLNSLHRFAGLQLRRKAAQGVWARVPPMGRFAAARFTRSWLEPLRESQMARETQRARYGSAGTSDSVDWLNARSIVNYYFIRLREAAAAGERIGPISSPSLRARRADTSSVSDITISCTPGRTGEHHER